MELITPINILQKYTDILITISSNQKLKAKLKKLF